MIENRKLISLAIVLVMVLSGFAALLPLAGAEYYNQTDENNISIWDEEISNYDPNSDEFWQYEIYPGTQNVIFDIWMRNGGGGTDGDLYWCNLSINTGVLRDENGDTIPSSYLIWDDPTVDDPANGGEATIFDGNLNEFQDFQFDVADDAEPGIYNLTVTMSYETAASGGSSKSYIGFVLFEVRYRAVISDIGGLIPGDMEKDVNVNVNFQNANPNWSVEDITLDVTLPDSDFWWFGLTSLTATQSTTAEYWDGNTWSPQFMLSVSSLKEKGTYTGSYSLTYTTNQPDPGNPRTITETGTIEFVVGDVAMLAVTVASDQNTLAQGTSNTTWTLTFENVGTVDLLAIECQLDDDSDAFTYTLADHWEDGGTVSYNWLDLGDLDVGDTVTRSMDVGIDLYIPVGKHKVMFTFQGKYFDPDSQSYNNVNVGWVDGGADGHDPQVTMGGNTFTLTPDTSSLEGPYIWITVLDSEIDVSIIANTQLSMAARLVDNGLMLTVQNYGNIDYNNVILRIETNSDDSPFLNVVDPDAGYSEEAIVGTLTAGNGAAPTLRVDLVEGTAAGVYNVPVEVSAVNTDMGEAVTAMVDARVTISGTGPKLVISEVLPETVKNGKDFTLTLTIENIGDDTARNIVITMPGAGQPPALLEEPNEINGDTASPGPEALPIFIDSIAPGATETVEIPMKANKDMSSGHVYVINLDVDYVDSFGNSPSTSDYQVSVKSSGMGGSTVGLFYFFLTILIMVVTIILVVYTVIYVKRYRAENPKAKKDKGAPPAEEPAPYQSETPPPPYQGEGQSPPPMG